MDESCEREVRRPPSTSCVCDPTVVQVEGCLRDGWGMKEGDAELGGELLTWGAVRQALDVCLDTFNFKTKILTIALRLVDM
eukprot:60477-Chlamydomonas_euryale.AAC.3